MSIGIPFGPRSTPGDANSIVTTFVAAILGLGLNEAAYMAEIVRAGILSVDEGQTEAAHALGMRRMLIMRRVVLPQAMRVIIPPTGNETISMLKTTSLVVGDRLQPSCSSRAGHLQRQLQDDPAAARRVSFWYLLITSILSVGQYYLERRFARGSSRTLPPTPLQRLVVTCDVPRQATDRPQGPEGAA